MKEIELTIPQFKPYSFYNKGKLYTQRSILELVQKGICVKLFDENGRDITIDSLRKMKIKHQKEVMRFNLSTKSTMYDYATKKNITISKVIDLILTSNDVEVVRNGKDVTDLFLVKAIARAGHNLPKERLKELVDEVVSYNKNKSNIMKMLGNFKKQGECNDR